MRYKDASTKNLDQNIRDLLKNNFDVEQKTFTKGIFFTGNTGTGKTYALHAIRNHLRIHEIQCSLVKNWVELLFELKEKMGNGYLGDHLSSITDSDIVFIDDIGAEKQTEWGQEMLYLIINKIYNQTNPIFISTNLTFQEFSEKYGDRLTSRILEMCDMVELTGEDKRIN